MAELDTLTTKQLEDAAAAYNKDTQRFDIGPTAKQLIGRTTICCLILNRTIGSGIFTVPARVLSGTGSVGASMLVWTACGFIVICGLCCWLEMGLTVPIPSIRTANGDEKRVSTPRSGGEKNFIEYIYKKPRLFINCVYGITYLILGNISGNAIAFGFYVMKAAGRDVYGDKEHNYWNPEVIGLAIASLTLCAALHMFTRRGGIWVNNAFAIIKVSMLVSIIIMGFVQTRIKRSKGIDEPLTTISETYIRSSDSNNAFSQNFDRTFHGMDRKGDLGSISGSFLNVFFSYAGFEQPFYVLSEVRNPRRVFPWYTIGTMIFAISLYILTNVAYYCVVPKSAYLTDDASTTSVDIAGLFFHLLFDHTGGSRIGERTMAGLTAVSVFGNILVMTFTAARVKREIAKEGILPFSLFFASGYTTPWAKWRHRRQQADSLSEQQHDSPEIEGIRLGDHLEQSPIPALILHWFTSIVLVLISLPWKKPALEYSFLITLYSYVIICIIGFFVSCGLVYLKLDAFFGGRRHWNDKTNWTPYLDPIPAVVYCLATSFFLITAFVSPKSETSPFHKKYMGYDAWVVPLIGIGVLCLGVIWWLGLLVLEKFRAKRLVVTRTPYIVRDDDGNYVQKVELVTHEWEAILRQY